MARYYPSSNKRDGSPLPTSGNDTLEDNGISRWLYEGLEGKWTQSDQDRFEKMYSVDGMRQYLDYLLDRRTRENLFNLYGIQYSDIRDPRNVAGVRSTAAMNQFAINFVSDNIKRLYR